MPSAPPTAEHAAYTVFALTRALKERLESGFPAVWVEGELSNFKAYPSGHWYFTLKDEHAQLRCVMFRGNNLRVRPQPADGDQLLVRGRVSLYDKRGDLQLICDHLQPAGVGALQREFERLKQRLQAEGLFDPARRRPLPVRPRHIGVITSDAGAALHDILDTLQRRWPLVEVFLWPAPVQGAAAAPAIATALAGLPRRAPVELIILARGGGSLEDLWAFNEESVARAVRACAVPVITGVGHETDFTIADFAADLRAPTPTAAAERATPDAAELSATLATLQETLRRNATERRARAQAATDTLTTRLLRQHPRRVLHSNAQAIDDLLERLAAQHPQRILDTYRQRLAQTLSRMELATTRRVETARHRVSLANTRLGTLPLMARVGQRTEFAHALERRLRDGMTRQLGRRTEHLRRARQVLAALGPAAVLNRGFAWATDANGQVLRDVRTLAAGDAIRVHLHRGSLGAEIRELSPETPADAA